MRKYAGLVTFLALASSTAFSFPKDIQSSKIGFTSRKSKVVEWWANGGYTDFGNWEQDGQNGSGKSLRKIAAGLTAMKMGYAFAPSSSYPTSVEGWLWANADKFKRAGTDLGNGNGDYDFWLIQIISLLYAFKDDPSLLTNTAVQALVCQTKTHASCNVPYAGQSLSEVTVAIDWNGYMGFGLHTSLPETENHLLMIYT